VRRSGGVAAIDIGTTKVCTLVGGFDDQGRLRITGSGITASKGMTKGIVDDVGKATEAIAASIRAAERASNTRIMAATVGIAGAHITSLNSRGTVALPNLQKAITEDDVRRALEGARTVAIPNNREILHALPRFFVLDGEESAGDPIGKFGHRLDVDAHIITGAVTAIQNLTKCVEAAGVQVDGLVLEPVAAADAVLDEEERTHGVVLADIGGGTTDVAVFVEGSILHTAVLPVGGNNITNDVVYGLRAPFSAADAAKEIYGHAVPSSLDPDDMFEIEAFGTERVRTISRRRLAEIIQARVEEIFDLITDQLGRAGYVDMVSAGIVLTGGSANLAGIAELAEQALGMPARIGSPTGVHNLGDTLSNPAFSTSIGLLGWAVREHDAILRPARASQAQPAGNTVWRRVSSLARIMLPE
jgi:cell division protein FtsA